MSRICLFALLFLATTAAALSQQPPIIPLPDASWQYHAGDDPRCATLSGAGCTLVSAKSRSFTPEPIFWRRMVVGLSDSLRIPQQLELLIEGAPCNYEVYVNGHLIGRHGDMKTRRGPYNARAVFSFPSALAENGVLAISTRNSTLVTGRVGSLFIDPLASAVGQPGPVRGRFAENTDDHLRAQWQHYLCFLLVFCIGLFFLLLYALDRGSEEHLWLALHLCAVSSLRFLEFAWVVNVGLNALPALVFYVLGNIPITVAGVQFGFSLIKRPVWRLFRFCQIIALLQSVILFAFLPLAVSTQSDLTKLWHFIVPLTNSNNILGVFALVVPLRSCFKSPLSEMRWIGGALLFLCFENVNRQLALLQSNAGLHLHFVPQHIPVGYLDLDIRGIAYLLFALVMMVAMTVRFRRLQSRNRQVELDLEAARTVQRLLIPSHAPKTPGFAIESFYLPAQEVGGDFFHVSPASDDSVLVVVGDVSGKGLSAAMTVSTVIGALRNNPIREPSEVLTHLNQTLHGFISGFATCCVALLTPEGHLTLANAGHLNPYRNGAELSLSGSLPLGLSSDVIYSSVQFSLGPGDRLTFVSDGVVESTGLKGELFGFERTAAISGESAQSIASAAQSFGAGAQADDITVLTLDCIGRLC